MHRRGQLYPRHAPVALPRESDPVPTVQRQDGCQERSKRVRGKSRLSPGFETQTVQHAASHYTILAHPCKYCRILFDIPAI